MINMAEQLYCPKCRKTMADTNFYMHKDGTREELCKNCLTLHVNNFEPDTFLWILEKFDVPYIEREWNVLRDRAYAKDPHKVTGCSIVGKYLSKMKLKQWKNFSWADTERLKLEEEEKAKLKGYDFDSAEAKIEEMRQAMERGEISEAQFKTYEEITAPPPVYIPPTPEVVEEAEGGNDGFHYPQGAGFEQVELEDVGAQLTQEDKVYLAMKWGRLYRADEWVALEQLYNEFMNSFDIQGAARIDTLKKICKTSLKMDQAIDCGDVDSYQKLSRVYDAMMKSAKFTEAQRKEEKSGEFDSVGQIVFFAEKEKGKIGRHEFDYEGDIIDDAINNLKRYNKELIESDTALAQQIENYLKRRASAEEHAADLAEAEKMGLDYVPLTDEDFIELKESEHEDTMKDRENFAEEEEDES